MSQIKGPALFLAQFAQDIPPYNTLENITQWARDLGFIGVQIPASDKRLIDLDKAAESKQYCDDLKGRCNGLAITELATHLLGQLVAVHPAYDVQFGDAEGQGLARFGDDFLDGELETISIAFLAGKRTKLAA